MSKIDRNIPIIGGQPELPPGQVNMGDMDNLSIEDFQDKVMQKALANANSNEVACPEQWETYQATETKELYRPVISIPGLAKYELPWRDKRLWFEGERQQYMMVFANVCSNYIFGVDMFIEKKKGNSVQFKPNPEFADMDVMPMPKAERAKIQAAEQEAKDNAEIPEGLLPLYVFSPKKKLENVLTCVEASSFDEWVNNLPKEIEVANYKATGEVVSKRKFRQIIKHR